MLTRVTRTWVRLSWVIPLCLVASLGSAQVRSNVGESSDGGASAASADSRTFHALLIGVQDYTDPGIKSLANPISDVLQVRDLLTKTYSFEPEHVTLLKNPGRRAILRSLDSLGRVLGDTDNLIVFYAGHGVWDKNQDEGFWLPADAEHDDRANWLSNDDIRRMIRGIRAQHSLLIADACFAGGILMNRDGPTDVQGFNKLARLPSRKAMTSGAITTVPDRSVFVRYLIKKLTDNAAPMISAAELFTGLRIAVINNSPIDQTPQYGTIREAGDEGGDFVLVRRKVAPLTDATGGGAGGAGAVGGGGGGRDAPRYDVPQLQGTLKYMKFFESGKGVPKYEDRSYSTVFDSAATRYVNVEMEIAFPGALNRRVSVPISCTYVRPTGVTMNVVYDTLRPSPDWKGILFVEGLGFENTGQWPPGAYRVRCDTNLGTFASGTFEIAATTASLYPVAALNGRVSQLRFWEQGLGSTLPVDSRQYASTFREATTRAVGVELTLDYPAQGRTISVPVSCTRFWPNGTAMAKADTGSVTPDPSWTGSYWSPGALGWDEPGNYTPGRYRVDCESGGRLIASGSFEVTSPIVIPSLSARLSSMKFWETPGGYIPPDQRKYSWSFNASKTRYIGIELGFTMPAVARKPEIPVACVRYNPDGTVLGRDSANLSPEVGWTGAVFSAGTLGWEKAGYWQVGTHRVECSAGGQVIASGTFNVVAGEVETATETLDSLGVIPDLNARVLEMQFWEEGSTPITRPNRTYSKAFYADASRYIGIELHIRFTAPGRIVTVPIACTRYYPDGTVMALQEGEIKVQADWTGAYWSAQGFGWAEPGNFKVGTYVVDCKVQGTRVALGRFQMVTR